MTRIPQPDHPAALMFQARALGLPEPVRELRFAEPRRFRFDLAWPEQMVAVEVDGGTWLPGGGRHNRPAGFWRDSEKVSIAASLGWRVLRVTPSQIEQGLAVTWLKAALEKRVA